MDTVAQLTALAQARKAVEPLTRLPNSDWNALREDERLASSPAFQDAARLLSSPIGRAARSALGSSPLVVSGPVMIDEVTPQEWALMERPGRVPVEPAVIKYMSDPEPASTSAAAAEPVEETDWNLRFEDIYLRTLRMSKTGVWFTAIGILVSAALTIAVAKGWIA